MNRTEKLLKYLVPIGTNRGGVSKVARARVTVPEVNSSV